MNLSWQPRALLSIAGVSLLVATIGGAIGSHVLTDLDERALHAFSTAVEFQFFHGLGLVAITLTGLCGIGGRALWLAAWLMVAGTVLFCGSIYAATFGAPHAIEAAAPYGGVSFMLGWALFAASAWLGRPARS